jgi:phospholipase/carboxylesterase
MRTTVRYIYLLIGIISIQISSGENFIMNTKDQILPDGFTLKYLVQEPQIKSGKKKAIILLHGFGSNEEDLFSLANLLPKDFYIMCPRGLYTRSAGSYAWYSVDFSTVKPVYNTEQEIQSRKDLIVFIKQMKDKYQLEEVYLGGFSQGAIMSASIGLLQPKEVKGVFCLSGRILEEIKSKVKKGSDLQKLKVFMAHGTHDNTLPISNAREAKTYFEQLKVKLSYHEYNMEHQITIDVLNELNKWLKE